MRLLDQVNTPQEEESDLLNVPVADSTMTGILLGHPVQQRLLRSGNNNNRAKARLEASTLAPFPIWHKNPILY